MTADQRKGALQLKPLYQRALVAVSGPLANFILAIVILTGLCFYAGRTMVMPDQTLRSEWYWLFAPRIQSIPKRSLAPCDRESRKSIRACRFRELTLGLT